MFVCWSSKGGSGTTVVSAALAILLARSGRTLLVDMSGDATTALGMAEPSGPGVGDWMRSPQADLAALTRLTLDVSDSLDVLPCGASTHGADRHLLGDALRAVDASVVVDAGLGAPGTLLAPTDHSLLVTTSCYLSLRAAVRCDHRPTGVVLVTEPGRALTARDVERAIGAPVVAQVPYDVVVFRSVDAGLLASRLPASLAAALQPVADLTAPEVV